MSTHAVRLESAGASVTVVSANRVVTDWSARYFGPWWEATEVPRRASARVLWRSRRWTASSTTTRHSS
ncbi:hypothetical protein ACQPXT_13115 [Streptomyces sp. CA-100214]